ncbi:hypothetical protein FC90_GL001484 [Latilactobacillus graminis DSM 20719]|uniref:Sulfatase N-terminal domain-containing protein n=2 Tax=Latilactobacillus graminis TaxID=60519 RepID=A0AA89KW76_9LACO|nr:hypothetical protein FC90_GL001484 [Latilactobacillus graminis DSM 20719]
MLTLGITGFLLLLNRIMLSNVTVPNESGMTYLVYTLILALSILGTNFVPLYFGYHLEYFKKIKLSKILLWLTISYLFASMVSVLFGFLIFKNTDISFFWMLFFPISQGSYPFATATVAVFIILPLLFKLFSRLNSHQLKQLLVVLTIIFIGAPTLFGKDIWSFQMGGMLILNIYLVLIGYGIQYFRFNTQSHLLLKTALSGFIYFGMTIIMRTVSFSIHGDYGTMNRFNVPYSLFAFIFSVYIFSCLEGSRIDFKIKLNYVAAYLVSAVIVSTQFVNISNITHTLKIAAVLPPLVWLFKIVVNLAILFLCVCILTVGIVLIHRLSFMQRWLDSNSNKSLSDIGNWIELKLKKNANLIAVMVSFYFITVVQIETVAIIIASNNGTLSLNSLLSYFFNGQSALILTTIIMTLIFFLLFLITNRFWYSYGFLFILELIVTVSTALKIILRHEPILPTDMAALKNIVDIVNMVSPIVITLGLIGVVISLVIVVILQLKYGKHFNVKISFRKRIISAFLILLMLSGLFFVNHANAIPSRVFALFKIQKLFYDQERGAQNNGPILQYINNLDVSIMERPTGYSETTIHKIMKKYDQEALKMNRSRAKWAKNQTVIFVLSESFSDPSRVPNLNVSKTPIPNVLKLKKQTTSGLMMSSGYGGGTANMEWQALTGLNLSSLSPTLATPYSQLVDKMAVNPNITNLFDQKIAIHPYNAGLYNRQAVFKKFGFQKFYFDGSKTNKLKYKDTVASSPYISDQSAYKETERLISKDNRKTQFIQLSTMQNHLPFDVNSNVGSDGVTASGGAIGDNIVAVNNYIQRLQDTDAAVKEFIQKLDQNERPITVVWYGDHLPAIYSGLSMSEYAIPLHQTDYFIYNNKAAKKNAKRHQLVAPYSFSALALSQANIKTTPYYALIAEVSDKVPAAVSNPATTEGNTYNGTQVFIKRKNKVLNREQLSNHQKTVMRDYRLIQYDLVAGNQYSAKWATQKVDNHKN